MSKVLLLDELENYIKCKTIYEKKTFPEVCCCFLSQPDKGLILFDANIVGSID